MFEQTVIHVSFFSNPYVFMNSFFKITRNLTYIYFITIQTYNIVNLMFLLWIEFLIDIEKFVKFLISVV